MSKFLYSIKGIDYGKMSYYTSVFLKKQINTQKNDSKSEKQLIRDLTGDHWNVFGKLQLSFMITQGLQPQHTLLDVGCGCFRGGAHFIEYLNPKNYYGLDINEQFIQKGYEYELVNSTKKLYLKCPKSNIVITDHYDASKFGIEFDYMWSLSLWTHLNYDECLKCLQSVMKNMKKNGTYFTTFFLVSEEDYQNEMGLLSELPEDGGILTIPTFPDHDPYHFTEKQLTEMADLVGVKLTIKRWNEWGMLRKHDIAIFVKK